jgi:hypothetical protein
MEFAIGADQQLFRGATLSVNYLNTHGVHQFLSQNINAPTVDSNGNLVYPVPPTDGTAPAVIKQYQSEGVYRQNELIMNANIRNRYLSLFGYYVLNFAKSDTSGINSFPSQPYNIGADYGRASFDRRNRLFLGGNVSLPYYISVSPFIIASSGTPYNVTLGRDLNNDSIFNDRPAFGAANGIPAGQSGSNTIAGCGSFVTPAPGQASIPINYCTGPALFVTNLRVSKTFGFGPSTRTQNQGGPGGGGPGGGHGDHGGGHGGPGGGRGPGGSNTGRKYNLTFSAQVQNLFNNADYATPNSTLTSQNLFGKSTQLAGGPYTSNSSLRRISLNLSFNF